MTPRTGRPPIGETTKDKRVFLRVSDDELEKLNYCKEILGLSKAEVIRRGIDNVYKEAQKKARK